MLSNHLSSGNYNLRVPEIWMGVWCVDLVCVSVWCVDLCERKINPDFKIVELNVDEVNFTSFYNMKPFIIANVSPHSSHWINMNKSNKQRTTIISFIQMEITTNIHIFKFIQLIVCLDDYDCAASFDSFSYAYHNLKHDFLWILLINCCWSCLRTTKNSVRLDGFVCIVLDKNYDFSLWKSPTNFS